MAIVGGTEKPRTPLEIQKSGPQNKDLNRDKTPQPTFGAGLILKVSFSAPRSR